jgi:MFS family permease
MRRFAFSDLASLWSRNLMILSAATFLNSFGQGLLGGASMNYMVQTLGLSGGQVLSLEGIREVPGLALIFIAALTMRLPLALRGTVAIAIMGVGYFLYGTVSSFAMLVVVAIIASLGMHMYMPVSPSLTMCLTTKDKSGRIMGAVASVGALASLSGMGAVALSSRFLQSLPLNSYYYAGGVMIVIASLVLLALPKGLGSTKIEPPRMLVKARYWLYYVLTFFEGSRKEVLGTFVTLSLVKNFGFQTWHISSLLLTVGICNFFAAPVIGYLIDRFGERRTLAFSYVCLALGCLGYATIRNLWVLIPMILALKMMIPFGMGLSTYVNRIAPPQELTPTLSAGVSINHVTSVAMPLIAGALLPVIGYDGIFIGTGAIIACSVPFALALRVPKLAPAKA